MGADTIELTREELTDLTSTLGGIEAGRRVGWAKYYDEATSHERDIRSAGQRLGIVLEVLHRDMLSRSQMMRAVHELLNRLADDDPAHEAAVEDGRRWARSLVGEDASDWRRFAEALIDVNVASRPVGSDAAASGEVVEHRCGTCEKLLAKATAFGLEIKCCSCKQFTTIPTEQAST